MLFHLRLSNFAQLFLKEKNLPSISRNSTHNLLLAASWRKQLVFWHRQHQEKSPGPRPDEGCSHQPGRGVSTLCDTTLGSLSQLHVFEHLLCRWWSAASKEVRIYFLSFLQTSDQMRPSAAYRFAQRNSKCHVLPSALHHGCSNLIIRGTTAFTAAAHRFSSQNNSVKKGRIYIYIFIFWSQMLFGGNIDLNQYARQWFYLFIFLSLRYDSLALPQSLHDPWVCVCRLGFQRQRSDRVGSIHCCGVI